MNLLEKPLASEDIFAPPLKDVRIHYAHHLTRENIGDFYTLNEFYLFFTIIECVPAWITIFSDTQRHGQIERAFKDLIPEGSNPIHGQISLHQSKSEDVTTILTLQVKHFPDWSSKKEVKMIKSLLSSIDKTVIHLSLKILIEDRLKYIYHTEADKLKKFVRK